MQLGDEAGEPAAQLVVARGPRRGDRATYAAGGIGCARHARLELIGAVAAEDEVGVRVDEPRDDGPAPGIHRPSRTLRPDRVAVSRCVSRTGGGGPTQAMRLPSISTAASWSVPHGSPSAATLVVSSPMFVISVALTGRSFPRPEACCSRGAVTNNIRDIEAADGGRAHSIGTFRPRSRATSFARS